MRPLVLLFCFALPRLAASQVADSTICYAAPWFTGGSGYRLWPDDAWQSGQDTTRRSTDFVVRQLAGTYRMIEVTTEGVDLRHHAKEWRLTLGRPRADRLAHWTQRWRGHAEFFPLAGERRLLRAGSLDSTFVSVPEDSIIQEVRLIYRGRDHLTLQGAPFEVFGGTGGFYWVWEVAADGSFSGRWEEGGVGHLRYPVTGRSAWGTARRLLLCLPESWLTGAA